MLALVPRDEPRTMDATEIAKHIRADLKAAYPDVVFSVRTHKYAGGSSVTAYWTDGPTTKAIDKIVDRFEGFEPADMSDYSPARKPFVLNGELVRSYSRTFATRSISDAVRARILARLAARGIDERFLPGGHPDSFHCTAGRTTVVGATLIIERR